MRLDLPIWAGFVECRLFPSYNSWSREESIQYFLRYTSDSREGIVVEVDRYITWPGQATAYKVGELKINDLRRKAETELGKVLVW